MARRAQDPWIEKLKGGEAPVYLLHGEESYFSRQAALWLKDQALQGGVESFNLERVNVASQEVNLTQLVNSARTPPMMAHKRVLWLQRVEVLNTWPKERLTPLLDYLKAPDEGSCLILEAEGKLDKKRALYKALTHKSAPVVVVEEERLKGAALTRYAQREASALGLKVSDDALALLQEASEEELNQVRDGLQKLKMYVGERVEVTREDVEALLPEAGLQAQIWDIADLVMDREQGRVLEVTRALLSALPSQSERARLTILLHTLLVKRVQGAMSAHALRKTGGDANQLATLTGMHPYGAKKLMQSMSRSRFSPSDLARALRLLLHADQALKGGKLPSELVLERLLIDVCML